MEREYDVGQAKEMCDVYSKLIDNLNHIAVFHQKYLDKLLSFKNNVKLFDGYLNHLFDEAVIYDEQGLLEYKKAIYNYFLVKRYLNRSKKYLNILNQNVKDDIDLLNKYRSFFIFAFAKEDVKEEVNNAYFHLRSLDERYALDEMKSFINEFDLVVNQIENNELSYRFDAIDRCYLKELRMILSDETTADCFLTIYDQCSAYYSETENINNLISSFVKEIKENIRLKFIADGKKVINETLLSDLGVDLSSLNIITVSDLLSHLNDTHHLPNELSIDDYQNKVKEPLMKKINGFEIKFNLDDQGTISNKLLTLLYLNFENGEVLKTFQELNKSYEQKLRSFYEISKVFGLGYLAMFETDDIKKMLSDAADDLLNFLNSEEVKSSIEQANKVKQEDENTLSLALDDYHKHVNDYQKLIKEYYLDMNFENEKNQVLDIFNIEINASEDKSNESDLDEENNELVNKVNE